MQNGRRQTGPAHRAQTDRRYQNNNEYYRSGAKPDGGYYGAPPWQAQYERDPRQAQYGRDPRQAQYERDPRQAQYGRDPRQTQYGRDPRQAQYGRDPRQAQYERDPRQAQYGRDPRQAQYGRDPRQSQYGRDQRQAQYGRDPRQAQYGRDPRAEAYIRQRREAQLRAERARRIEYERRRAAAREARRKLEEQLKKERKMRRRRMRKIFFGRTAVCLVIFAILATMAGIFTALHFNSSPDSPPSRVVYTFGGDEKRTATEDTAFRNGKLYVCFNDVADYLKLSVTGDTNSMKFVFTDSDDDTETGSAGDGYEDSVTFISDSRTVVINGQTVSLSADSVLYGEEVWVSAEFIEEYIDGLSVTRSGKTVAVARIEDPLLSSEDTPVFLDVSLKLKHTDPHPDIDLEEGEDDVPVMSTMPESMDFLTDLSDYEQYMVPENADEYLLLVNTEHTLDGTYAPTDLTGVINTRQDGRDTQQLRLYAAKALEALYIEMQAAGFTDVSVMSAYRDYWTQNYLHNYYIEQEMAADPSLTWEAAEAIVTEYSAKPGTSEHQTGLCIDMHNLSSADVDFANQPAYEWLADNAWKFGYILRFPEDKTSITGISFEPWHWRYVGREAAWEIYSSNICLEEYVK